MGNRSDARRRSGLLHALTRVAPLISVTAQKGPSTSRFCVRKGKASAGVSSGAFLRCPESRRRYFSSNRLQFRSHGRDCTTGTTGRTHDHQARAPRPTAPSGPPGLEKAPTGITGFDEITGGGLPRGRPTLVTGAAGSGKTLFGIEFLVRGARDFGEPGVLLAFEEGQDDLATNVASLGFDLEQLERDGLLAIDAFRLDPAEIVETGAFDLEGLFIRLAMAVESVGAKRVFLDTIELLFAAMPNEAIIRGELGRLFRWLKERGLTVVISGERGKKGDLTRFGIEEYVSDCVVTLDHRVEDQISTRRLRVVKYRGSLHGTNEYPFLITERGLVVVPDHLGGARPTRRRRNASPPASPSRRDAGRRRLPRFLGDDQRHRRHRQDQHRRADGRRRLRTGREGAVLLLRGVPGPADPQHALDRHRPAAVDRRRPAAGRGRPAHRLRLRGAPRDAAPARSTSTSPRSSCSTRSRASPTPARTSATTSAISRDLDLLKGRGITTRDDDADPRRARGVERGRRVLAVRHLAAAAQRREQRRAQPAAVRDQEPRLRALQPGPRVRAHRRRSRAARRLRRARTACSPVPSASSRSARSALAQAARADETERRRQELAQRSRRDPRPRSPPSRRSSTAETAEFERFEASADARPRVRRGRARRRWAASARRPRRTVREGLDDD